MISRVQRNRMIGRAAGLCALLFLFPVLSPASQQQYPRIDRLHRSDLLFRQVVDDINLAYRHQKSEGPVSPLAFYSYRVGEEDSLFTIAARFNLPYDAIATLNGLSHPRDCRAGRLLLIPNRPGIFVPRSPGSALEQLLVGNNARADAERQPVSVRLNGEERKLFFIPGSRFNATERSFFLHVFFRLPLPSGQITSGYGSRRHPFTDRRHFHHGIDIASPTGTKVIPARKGTVKKKGFDETLGNYVVITHEGGYTTTYGHLSEILVETGDQVHYGTSIGHVGSTGLSTGPHLHFEIRSGNRSKDPLQMLPVHSQ